MMGPCLVCGKECRYVTNKKTCSEECRKKREGILLAGKPKIRKNPNCKVCGADITHRHYGCVFCESCARDSELEHGRRLNYKRGNSLGPVGVVMACRLCGMDFFRKASGEKFCSKECSYKYTRIRENSSNKLKTKRFGPEKKWTRCRDCGDYFFRYWRVCSRCEQCSLANFKSTQRKHREQFKESVRQIARRIGLPDHVTYLQIKVWDAVAVLGIPANARSVGLAAGMSVNEAGTLLKNLRENGLVESFFVGNKKRVWQLSPKSLAILLEKSHAEAIDPGT